MSVSIKAKIKGERSWMDAVLVTNMDGTYPRVRFEYEKVEYGIECIEFKKEIDWDEYRCNAAKEILVGLCSNRSLTDCSYKTLAAKAVSAADELVKTLNPHD